MELLITTLITIDAELTMQQVISFFKHFKSSKHTSSLFLSHASNSLYDIIMMSGMSQAMSQCKIEIKLQALVG